MTFLRLAGACCLCLMATVAGFVALQAFALTLTSDTAISARLRESLDRGGLIERSYPDSPFGHRLDNFTECLALGTNLDNRDQLLLRRLALTPNVGHPSTQDACPALAAALRDGTAHAPLVIPIVWVEVLRHHSVNHFFVARTFVLYGAAPALAAAAIAGGSFRRGTAAA